MSIRIASTRILSTGIRSQIRSYSTPSVEETIKKKLQVAFTPSALNVQDTSGGCGSFFSIDIVSSKFNDLSTIKRQRMINKELKEEISSMHGLTLRAFSEAEQAKQ